MDSRFDELISDLIEWQPVSRYFETLFILFPDRSFLKANSIRFHHFSHFSLERSEEGKLFYTWKSSIIIQHDKQWTVFHEVVFSVAWILSSMGRTHV